MKQDPCRFTFMSKGLFTLNAILLRLIAVGSVRSRAVCKVGYVSPSKNSRPFSKKKICPGGDDKMSPPVISAVRSKMLFIRVACEHRWRNRRGPGPHTFFFRGAWGP